MKNRNIKKTTLALLMAGLLLVIAALSRYTQLPDGFKGFLTGMGLMLECLALAKISQRRKCAQAERVEGQP